MKVTKKVFASLFTAATLTVCLSSMTVNAENASDGNSAFYWYRYSKTHASTDTYNLTTTTRQATAAIFGYDIYGNYAGNAGGSRIVGLNESAYADDDLYDDAFRVKHSGVLYYGTMAVGTPLSSWSVNTYWN